MRPRSQDAGPKMNCDVLGWFRPVFDAKGRSGQRFRPLAPTATRNDRNCDNDASSSFIGRTSR
jgi:hypothetical protein